MEIKCAYCGKTKINYKNRGRFCSRDCFIKASYRKCVKCGEIKKHEGRGMCLDCYSEFYRNILNPESHKRSDRKKYLKNRIKRILHATAWNKANPDKRKEILRTFYKKDYPKNSLKYIARHLAQQIKIPEGEMCSDCSKNLATERHHPDYSKPLDIEFVCKDCHSKKKE